MKKRRKKRPSQLAHRIYFDDTIHVQCCHEPMAQEHQIRGISTSDFNFQHQKSGYTWEKVKKQKRCIIDTFFNFFARFTFSFRAYSDQKIIRKRSHTKIRKFGKKSDGFFLRI